MVKGAKMLFLGTDKDGNIGSESFRNRLLHLEEAMASFIDGSMHNSQLAFNKPGQKR